MKDLFINYCNLKNFQLINLNKIRVSISGMQQTMLNNTTIYDELVNDFINENGRLKKIMKVVITPLGFCNGKDVRQDR